MKEVIVRHSAEGLQVEIDGELYLSTTDPEPPAEPEPEPTPDPEPTPEPEPEPEPEPPPPYEGESLLLREAATMEPGEWRNIAHLTTWPGKADGRSFKQFQYDDGTSFNNTTGKRTAGSEGIGWTQRLVYHNGALLLLAMRDQAPVALLGMDPDGTWWRKDTVKHIDGEWVTVDEMTGWEGGGWSGFSGGRRPFNRLTQDDQYLYFSRAQGVSQLENGRMYRTPLDNPGAFEDAGHEGFQQSNISTVGSHAVLWVEEWGRFYGYTAGGHVWTRLPTDAGWTHLGRTPYDGTCRASGYAGEIVYNPFKDELIFIGGQSFGSPPGCSTKWVRLTEPLGEIEALPDLPEVDGLQLFYTSAQNKLMVHPHDGSYLLQVGREKVFRAADAFSDWVFYTDLWADAGRPFGNYESYAPFALIPGTDVFVFVSHMRGVVLHRVKALDGIQEPTTDTEPAPDPEPEPTQSPERPPASGSLEGTELQQKASDLAPGEWAWPLGADTFSGIWTHNTYANNSNDFWMPVAVWNPVQARMYGILDRTAGAHPEESVVILYYDAATDTWGNVEVPDLGGRFGSPHVYGRWAFDIGRQKLYRRTQGDVWELDLATHQWTNTGPRNSAWSDGIAMHEGTGELMYMDRQGVVYGWNPDNNEVREIGQNPAANERHSHGHYNTIRNEVCFSFGDGGNTLTLVSADGTVRAVDVPPEVRGGAGSATTFTFHDPISGNYLVYTSGARGTRKMWEFDPDGDQWKMAFDFLESDVRWPPYHGHLIAPVPELGVILWLHRSTHGDNRHQRIYRHKSAF